MEKDLQVAGVCRVLASAASDAEIRGLFLNLRNMKLGPPWRLENVFDDIGYPEAFQEY